MMAIVRFLVRFVFRLLVRVEVRGRVETSGKMLVVANHQSFFVSVLLGAFLSFAPTYLVHSTIASRWYFKWPLKFIAHLVIDSTNPLSMKRVVALLDRKSTRLNSSHV